MCVCAICPGCWGLLVFVGICAGGRGVWAGGGLMYILYILCILCIFVYFVYFMYLVYFVYLGRPFVYFVYLYILYIGFLRACVYGEGDLHGGRGGGLFAEVW